VKVPKATSVSVTPADQLCTRPCSRVFEGGYTFRLAKGDTGVAVFQGTCVEQRRVLVVRDIPFPSRPIEGPQSPFLVLPKPDAVSWDDNAALRVFARACMDLVHDRHRLVRGHSRRDA